MSNVVSLDGGRVPELGEPDASLIAVLENLLEHARSGRLQSFIGTGYCADGGRLVAWCDTHTDVYQMRGSLAWLETEYVARKVAEMPEGQHP